jgi:hypothetical protein
VSDTSKSEVPNLAALRHEIDRIDLELNRSLM